MKETSFRLTCAAAALVLAGCAHQEAEECRGCTTVYLEGGQLAIAHFVPADPSAVDRVAAAYCQEHHSGKPQITKHPELQKYSHWAVYLFACEDQGTDMALTKDRQDVPVVKPSATPASTLQPTTVQPPAAQPSSVQAPAVQPNSAKTPLDAEAAKLGATCTSLGFQKQTPEYGNCVLKLMELSHAQAEQLRQQQRTPDLQADRRPDELQVEPATRRAFIRTPGFTSPPGPPRC
jgi:hypothetical protein